LTERVWKIHDPVFESDEICPDYRVWPWNGHRLFAYDLMTFLRPRLFVELGTYWGTSFFSFCQAVKDAELRTRCVAIDTWEGDDHTGKYENRVFETVQSIAETIFQETEITLLRSYFADAVDTFREGTIDLLHIDGFHTYEAVKNDFTLWLPKLADDGVVLFHDIADSCDYGSVTYWHELLERYPGFSFQHSWGLGILFPKGDKNLDLMKKNNISDKSKIYEYLSELNLLRIQKEASDERGEKQHVLINHQQEQIALLKDQLRAARNEAEAFSSMLLCRILKKLVFKKP
jgi:hypothetical protein